MGPYILFFVIVFCIWLRFEIRKSNSLTEKSNAEFWERESIANSTRKKSLDSLDYITISEKTIPLIESNDETLSECVEEIRNLSSKKMLNLNRISNTELKLMYGPANLETLKTYDTNFNSFCTNLYKYSHRLLELNYEDEAICIMEYAISIGSDVTSLYRELGECYAKTYDNEKIISLLKYCDDNLSPLVKEATKNYIISL